MVWPHQTLPLGSASVPHVWIVSCWSNERAVPCMQRPGLPTPAAVQRPEARFNQHTALGTWPIHSRPTSRACCFLLQEYWESSACLARSVLVYNTGRSKGQLIWLLKEKPMLVVPDVLITAVGTKIWYLPDGMRAFQDPTVVEWIEDKNWSLRLDEGWDLQQVGLLSASIRYGVPCQLAFGCHLGQPLTVFV